MASAPSLRDRLYVPAASTLSLENLRNDEVSFVRATAAAWRLGHAADDNGAGGEDGAGVRVWLPPVRLNSTHDVAAGMSVAPECAVADGGVDGGGAGSAGVEGGDGGGVGFDAGEIRCKVRYTVTPSGVVEMESDVSMPEHWPAIPRCVSACGRSVRPSLTCDGLGASSGYSGHGRFDYAPSLAPNSSSTRSPLLRLPAPSHAFIS